MRDHVPFDTVKDALDAGLRPCKVCEPIERGGDVPHVMRELLRELHAHPHTRIKDSELRRRYPFFQEQARVNRKRPRPSR
ncbi:MAG: hypothetical protein PHI18_04765 [bacterium]|nr:hypothetical protein [bacterium]